MTIYDFLRNPFQKKLEEKPPVERNVNTVIIQDSTRGTSGTEVYAGYFDEEYLDTLKNKEKADEYDKIRRSDSQAKMLLSAVKNPIKTAPRDIVSKRDETIYNNHALFCKKVLFEDIDFEQFLSEGLTFYDFGHSIFEKCHKVNVDKPILNDEGQVILQSYIGLKKLGWRSPKTIETWNFCPERKELIGLTQEADGDLSSDAFMPIRHLVIMSLDKEGDNYEGISMLRACYGNYYRKKNYLKLNAIGIEKSMPLPTAQVPVGQENSSQFTNLITALEKFTTHQKNYLTFPAGWEVNLSNGTAYDPSKVEDSINFEDIRMAKAFLANFLELGLSGTGAFALSNDLSDFFLSGLICTSNIFKKAVDQLCKELVILNFGEQEVYPQFEFSGIKDKAGLELAQILGIMVKNKVVVPDDKLEEHVRTRYKLSKKSDDGTREVGASSPMSFSEKIKNAIKMSEKK